VDDRVKHAMTLGLEPPNRPRSWRIARRARQLPCPCRQPPVPGSQRIAL